MTPTPDRPLFCQVFIHGPWTPAKCLRVMPCEIHSQERPTGTEALTHIAKLIKERDPKPTGTEVDTSEREVWVKNGHHFICHAADGDECTPISPKDAAWIAALQAERDAAVDLADDKAFLYRREIEVSVRLKRELRIRDLELKAKAKERAANNLRRLRDPLACGEQEEVDEGA